MRKAIAPKTNLRKRADALTKKQYLEKVQAWKDKQANLKPVEQRKPQSNGNTHKKVESSLEPLKPPKNANNRRLKKWARKVEGWLKVFILMLCSFAATGQEYMPFEIKEDNQVITFKFQKQDSAYEGYLIHFWRPDGFKDRISITIDNQTIANAPEYVEKIETRANGEIWYVLQIKLDCGTYIFNVAGYKFDNLSGVPDRLSEPKGLIVSCETPNRA